MHVDVLVWGVNGFKKKKKPLPPSVHAARAERTILPSQEDRLCGSCIVEGRHARHTSSPPTQTHSRSLPLCASFGFFLVFFFFFAGLNYSGSLVAFRMKNSGGAA